MSDELPMSKKIVLLKQALDFCDYAEARGEQVGMTTPENPNPVHVKSPTFIQKGISDLDFDPYYFLGTGNTSPEGWALHGTR